MKVIAIKGAFGLGNFGDDALMIAVYKITIRFFESQAITFICRDAGYIKRLLPDVKVVSPDRERELNTHILLYGGGTQFFSFQSTYAKTITFLNRILNNLREPTHIGQKILQRIQQLLPHFKTTQKLVALGIGVGPFYDNSSRLRVIQGLFRRMDYIAVRDIESHRLCIEWGCKNVNLCSDLCYLPDLWKAYIPDKFKNNSKSEIRKIGVVIRDWPYTNEGNSYTEPLFQVVYELRSQGKEVKFIIFSNNYDRECVKRLNEKNEEYVAWNPEICTILEFIELLSNYDAFITARYHGAVFASILGKPVVCIEVEQKMRFISDLFGSGSRLWTYPFRVFDCLKFISDIESDYLLSVEFLARVVKEQGSLAEKIVNDFQKYLLIDKCQDIDNR